MKKEGNLSKHRESISRKELIKRNPVPFGDVRKYYYIASIGTVVLLALCFHISVAAIALRTDTCVQIPNGIIVVLLICALLVVIGHQTRSLVGYGLSTVCCLILILVMQLYNGGLALVSNLPEYGEVFRDGAKSTDFWILLAKVIAIVHSFLSGVFVKTTLTVQEEPPLKGWNANIHKALERFRGLNKWGTHGRRASDYWVIVVCLVLWMIVVSENPYYTGKYDYLAMVLILSGVGAIILQKSFLGAFLFSSSFLIQCTMYQWRLGIDAPTVAAYSGLWISIIFLFLEALRERNKNETPRKRWSIRLTEKTEIRIPPADEYNTGKGCSRRKISIIMYGAALLFVMITPVHIFLSSFSGSYMVYQKDCLPLFFFLPVIMALSLYSGRITGLLLGAASGGWLTDAFLNSSPLKNVILFRFDSDLEHGEVGTLTTGRMNSLVVVIIALTVVLTMGCLLYAIVLARKEYHGER